MASLLYQLVIIILVAITLQVLMVKGQGDDDEESDAKMTDIQKLINILLKLRAAQKEQKALAILKQVESEADSSDDGYDDDRQSRSNFKMYGSNLCMAVKIGQLKLESYNIVYKPSVLEEFGCYAINEENYGSVIKENRMLCYVRGNNCENSRKYMPVSVYKREKGQNCWISETRNISAGCDCHFPTQHLGYKPYHPGR